jgi:hypothetical protein
VIWLASKWVNRKGAKDAKEVKHLVIGINGSALVALRSERRTRTRGRRSSQPITCVVDSDFQAAAFKRYQHRPFYVEITDSEFFAFFAPLRLSVFDE